MSDVSIIVVGTVTLAFPVATDEDNHIDLWSVSGVMMVTIISNSSFSLFTVIFSTAAVLVQPVIEVIVLLLLLLLMMKTTTTMTTTMVGYRTSE